MHTSINPFILGQQEEEDLSYKMCRECIKGNKLLNEVDFSVPEIYF